MISGFDMGIGINLHYFHDEGLGSFNSLSDPRIPVIQKMIRLLDRLDEFASPKDYSSRVFDNGNAVPGPAIQLIDVVLVDNAQAIEAWTPDTDCLGFHVITDWQTNSDYADRHKVIIHLSNETLDDLYQINDLEQLTHKLVDWLITIPHELAHALEFIERSGGLTPEQLIEKIELDDIDVSIRDFCTGSGITMDKVDCQKTANSIMESRVETKAIDWFFKISDEIQGVVQDCADVIFSGIENQPGPVWPVIITSDPFCHVGAFGGKGPEERYSMEGSCLSVSDVPDAWIKIARLSGAKHYLQKERAYILDMLVAKSNPVLVNKAMYWAIDHDLAESKILYRATFEDEDGYECYSMHDCREDALAEVDGDEDCLGFENGYIGTKTLAKIHRCSAAVDPSLVVDFCLMAYAEHVLKVDGVWWNEVMDPDRLSAPRGGLFSPFDEEWEIFRDGKEERISISISKRYYFSEVKNDWVESYPESKLAEDSYYF